MRLAFLGTPSFAVPSLARLLACGHEIVCVYSQPPRPRGRGQRLTPSPVQAFAESHRLPVRTLPSLKTSEAIADFNGLELDAAIVVAFGQILVPAILDAPRHGCLNVHASLLPRWRGAAPIQRSIMAGDAVTGVQVMQMTAGLDEGPVYASASVRVGPLDTAGTLAERLSDAGAALLPDVLEALSAGRATAQPQSEDGLIYARKITPAETRIDWSRPATQIDGQIRGLAPSPGAWFDVAGDKGSVRIKALLSRAEDGSGQPGTVLDDALLVAAGVGAVRLFTLQREGRAPQDAQSFLRGFPLPVSSHLT